MTLTVPFSVYFFFNQLFFWMMIRVSSASGFYLRATCEPCKLLKIARNCAYFDNSCAQFHAIARDGIPIGNPNDDIVLYMQMLILTMVENG